MHLRKPAAKPSLSLKSSAPVRPLAPDEVDEQAVRPLVPAPLPSESIPAAAQRSGVLKPLLNELRALNRALNDSPKSALSAVPESVPAFTRKASFPPVAQLHHEKGALFSADAVEKDFEKQGVDPVLTQRILTRLYRAQTRQDAAPYHPNIPLRYESHVKSTFQRLVETMEAFMPSSEALKTKRRIALVGPTGVGKTTTIAKIASIFALRDNQSVALISLDTYRIAAAEQIKTYARLLSVPIEIVGNSGEFSAALTRFEKADVVLIDTPGFSPKDQTAIRGLGATLRQCPDLEVHLVLPASLRPDETRLTLEGFDPTRYNRLIFSKLDEAVSWGSLLNTWIFSGHTVSYFTIGQRVPEDLETASMAYLCDTLLSAQLPAYRKA
jgi:flagellar biosynthesis GTPase FlhF